MFQFKHVVYFLCSDVNKMWIYEIFRALHSIFTYILQHITKQPNILEQGYYIPLLVYTLYFVFFQLYCMLHPVTPMLQAP